MKTVKFNGYDTHPGKSFATPPLRGLWEPGDERVFDQALAAEYGRTCGDKCVGDCHAEYHAAVWNIGHEKQDPPPFEVMDIKKTEEKKTEKRSKGNVSQKDMAKMQKEAAQKDTTAAVQPESPFAKVEQDVYSEAAESGEGAK